MDVNAQAEFQQLWEQTCERLVRYLYCSCRNWSDANDLAQDCYLGALRNWGRFDGTGSRQAWLFAIARNRQVDWYRRQSRSQQAVAASGPASASLFDTQPDRDDLEMIWHAVDNLEQEQREIIHLKFAAGLSYEEIAGALRIPIGTVRSRLHRGLKAVKEQIRE